MKKIRKPSEKVLLATLRACLKNGERLQEESYDLEFRTPPSSRYFLVMIAQEEFAKAFILYLTREGTVPFSAAVLRAINDHACKQLVGVVMDYIIMHWETIEELQDAVRKDYALGEKLPKDVSSAMALLRFEKIGKWEGDRAGFSNKNVYDPLTRGISEGKKDRHKQDALYVRIGRDGRVCSTPDTAINEKETHAEFERAGRYRRFIDSLLTDINRTDRHEKAVAALRSLFVAP